MLFPHGRVIEMTGPPSPGDAAAIQSKFTNTMLESLRVRSKKPMRSLFPNTSADALDLLAKLLHFNPAKRCTVQQALEQCVSQVNFLLLRTLSLCLHLLLVLAQPRTEPHYAIMVANSKHYSPYMRQFHDDGDEPTLRRDIVVSIDDNKR
jgi:serine/threonine protein kinase